MDKDKHTKNSDIFKKELPTEDEVELEANSGTGIFSIFRIAKVERRMFCILALMFTLISFIYSVGRVFKDAAVLSRQMPLSINCLKTFIVLPITVLCVGVIQKFNVSYPFTKVFDNCLLIFSMMFIFTGFILLPYSHLFQLDSNYFRDIFADSKCVVRGYDVLLSVALVYNEWTSSLVYVLSEMFGNLILSYFFLTFANELTTPRQSARFVPLFYVCSNIALLLSGLLTGAFADYRKNISYETAEKIYNGFFVLSGAVILVIYLLKMYLEQNVTSKPIFIRKSFKEKGPKVKVGFSEGLREMMGSKLLLNISLIVMFYGISTNLIESSFKNSLTKGAEISGKTTKEYSMRFTSLEQKIAAVWVMVLLLSPFPKLIETKGWIYVAILCPLITLFSLISVCGLAFYNYPGTNNEPNFFFNSMCASADTVLIGLENYLGCIAVAFMKVAKYASFDISKEAISMRIDSSLRARYKGIFDGVFGKLGKSLGSLFVWGMGYLFQTRDIRKLSPISLFLVLTFVVIWINSVIYLNRKYKESVVRNVPIDTDLFSKKNEHAGDPEISTSVLTN
ncbi:hypothetical protein P3W45_000002 [Vairimorpha bombi]|jgi:ATP:ADP antiporter, AAA family